MIAYQNRCSDLTDYSEVDLVIALYEKGIDIDYIRGAYYAIEASADNRDDEIFGSSEEGRHGKQSETEGSIYDEPVEPITTEDIA